MSFQQRKCQVHTLQKQNQGHIVLKIDFSLNKSYL